MNKIDKLNRKISILNKRFYEKIDIKPYIKIDYDFSYYCEYGLIDFEIFIKNNNENLNACFIGRFELEKKYDFTTIEEKASNAIRKYKYPNWEADN